MVNGSVQGSFNIATVTLIVGICGALAAWMVVPEFRTFFGLPKEDKPPAKIEGLGTMTVNPPDGSSLAFREMQQNVGGSEPSGSPSANLQARSSGKAISNSSKRIIVLVPPFENVTGVRSEVKIDKISDAGEERKSITAIVDRYSEAPRTILEDILLTIPNIGVVERQQLDKLHLESMYSRFSGLVDSKYAIDIGKHLGANAIVIGTIANINETYTTFNGYGIKTNNKVIVATVRVRVIDIETSRILFSKTIDGTQNYMITSSGGVQNSDASFIAIKNALNSLRGDLDFTQSLGSIKNK